VLHRTHRNSEKPEEAWLFGKTSGVLAGVPFFQAVFDELGCTVEWLAEEGAEIDTASAPDGKVLLAKVRGPANKVLLVSAPISFEYHSDRMI
jgi:nicotinate-nucleotide pyrophosphorylase (carboxylating)